MANAAETAERIKRSVPAATDETQPEATTPETETAPAETPEAPVTQPEPETSPAPAAAPSARDNFRNRFAQKYSDVNMDDEDAYYGKANEMMDSYEDSENKLNNVRNAVGSSEDFQDMLAELNEWNQEHPDKPYSIMHYIAKKVRQGELDLDELQNNPEYADQIAEAQAQRTKDADEQKALDEEGAKNFDNSIAMMQRIRDERGLSTEQVNKAMEKLYGIFDDLKVNKITEESFKAVLDAMNYDKAVDEARQEGEAAGASRKINDTLRKMPKTSERAGGNQTPMPETKPAANNANMFGL